MNTHPDIEDIGDVTRYCMGAFFPMSFNEDGTCKEVFTPNEVVRSQVYGVAITAIEQRPHLMRFEDFLKIDSGPHKARMVETEWGSVVWVTNTETNARFHGLLRWKIKYFHREHEALDLGSWEVLSLQLLNQHRTPWSQGRKILEEGERVGIALSDRFGVIVTDTSEHPVIVYKNRIAGHIIGERFELNSQHQHLERVLDSLLVK